MEVDASVGVEGVGAAEAVDAERAVSAISGARRGPPFQCPVEPPDQEPAGLLALFLDGLGKGPGAPGPQVDAMTPEDVKALGKPPDDLMGAQLEQLLG